MEQLWKLYYKLCITSCVLQAYLLPCYFYIETTPVEGVSTGTATIHRTGNDSLYLSSPGRTKCAKTGGIGRTPQKQCTG